MLPGDAVSSTRRAGCDTNETQRSRWLPTGDGRIRARICRVRCVASSTRRARYLTPQPSDSRTALASASSVVASAPRSSCGDAESARGSERGKPAAGPLGGAGVQLWLCKLGRWDQGGLDCGPKPESLDGVDQVGNGGAAECNPARSAGPGEEILLDVRSVEIRAPDRVVTGVRPVDLAAVDRHAAGVAGGDDEALGAPRAVEVGPTDRAGVVVRPVEERTGTGGGRRHRQRQRRERQCRATQESRRPPRDQHLPRHVQRHYRGAIASSSSLANLPIVNAAPKSNLLMAMNTAAFRVGAKAI